MKKINILSFLVLLLVLSLVLAACGDKTTDTSEPTTECDSDNTEPPADENPESDTLSEELEKQILEDYAAYVYGDEYDPKVNGIFQIERYYGSYDGAVAVILTGSQSAYFQAMYTDVVAGIEILYSDYNFIKVWKDGSFFTMQEAYEQGILTAEQVAEIAKIKNDGLYENWIVALDDITRKEIEDVFAEDGNTITWFDINKENSEWHGVRCYGDFEGCIVLFEPGPLTVESEMTVADCKFEYPNSFGLYGYYEGALYTLSEAFENGYISKDDVAVAAEHHRMLEEVI